MPGSGADGEVFGAVKALQIRGSPELSSQTEPFVNPSTNASYLGVWSTLNPKP